MTQDTSLPAQVADGPVVPAPKKFLPWHKPRKQFIRKHQWGKASEKLIQDLKLKNVNYLTLPGKDFLDVITLAEICKNLGSQLKYLGFNNSQSNEDRFSQTSDEDRFSQMIELFDVNGRELPIQQDSHVFNYPIESIAHRAKVWNEFKNKGPFDIINMDTCGSFANKGRFNNKSRTVDALRAILESQFTRCGHDWLLFLTTNLSHQNFNEETFRQLMKTILENANNSEEFESQAKKCIGLEANESLSQAISSLPSVESERFVKQCTLGISKWILHLLQDKQKNQWQMEVLDSYFYSTEQVPDMLSIAFKFRRLEQIVHDKSGLTLNPDAKTDSAREDVRLAKRLSYMRDLDSKLGENEDCREKLIIEAADQLKQRGYDTGDSNHSLYRDWLKSLLFERQP